MSGGEAQGLGEGVHHALEVELDAERGELVGHPCGIAH